jgi:FMN phosphatase YigB (HAD superfamily)
MVITSISISQLYSNNLSFDFTNFISGLYQHQQKSLPDASKTDIKSIMFDLDGVLCQTNKMKAFYDIGLPVTLNFIYDQQKLPSEKVVFDTLAGVPAKSIYQSYNKGLLMPQILIDWQTGLQSLVEIQETIKIYLQNAPFSESQKSWVMESVMMMTTPARFIGTRQIISANVRLLHELKKAGYKIYILSNWDTQSFPLFQKTFPEIFTYNNAPMFDGIMISGNVGTLKPESRIFKLALEHFNLKPASTIFIDDESANITAAKNYGILTILANPADPASVRTDLMNLLQKQ